MDPLEEGARARLANEPQRIADAVIRGFGGMERTRWLKHLCVCQEITLAMWIERGEAAVIRDMIAKAKAGVAA